MKKIVLIVLVFGVVVAFTQPQDSKHAERWEKYRAEKVAFLTTNQIGRAHV